MGDNIADQIITAPIPTFCIMSGLGRSRVYELIAAGELESVTVGRRRLVLIESYKALIERQRAAGKKLPRPGAKAA